MNPPEHVRAWLYRIATAALPLLILYGVLGNEEAAVWLGALAALLNFGQGALASVNTSTHSKD